MTVSSPNIPMLRDAHPIVMILTKINTYTAGIMCIRNYSLSFEA